MVNVFLTRRGLGRVSAREVAKFSKHDFKVVRSDGQLPQDVNYMVRWGCTSRLPARKTINKAAAITNNGNKLNSRKMLIEAGVNTPPLYEDGIEFPCVVRKQHHAQGKHFYFCKNTDDLKAALEALEGEEIYISGFIDKEREFGVFFFNNRIWQVVEKVPVEGQEDKEHIIWNVSHGTHRYQYMKWSEWPMGAITEVLKAAKASGLDFGRADVIEKDGKFYILEINSAHTLKSEYAQQRFANVIDYFIDNGPVKNEVIEQPKTYKSIIHPALRENKQGLNL